jgi:hypothetical protein
VGVSLRLAHWTGNIAWAAWPQNEADWFYRRIIRGEANQGIQFKFDVDDDPIVVRRDSLRSVGEYLEKYFTIELWKNKDDRGWAEI